MQTIPMLRHDGIVREYFCMFKLLVSALGDVLEHVKESTFITARKNAYQQFRNGEKPC